MALVSAASAGGRGRDQLPNRVELVVAMFAAWRLGAAVTPINPALTAGRGGLSDKDSGAQVVVHEAPLLDVPGVAATEAAARQPQRSSNPPSTATTPWPC